MKNKFLKLLACLVLLLLTNSCLICSLHPLWTEDSRIFDERLLGKWYTNESTNQQNEDEFQYFEFTNSGDTAYTLKMVYKRDIILNKVLEIRTQTDTIHYINYHATMTKLGKHFFLDLYPTDTLMLERFEENYLPVHSFVKINLRNNSLEMYELDGENLDRLFEQNRIRLRHEIIDDFTVLTASTKELRQFMTQYADDPEAFENVEIFTKR